LSDSLTKNLLCHKFVPAPFMSVQGGYRFEWVP
jgi:hypothetical protein